MEKSRAPANAGARRSPTTSSGLPRAREIVVARPRDARSVTRVAVTAGAHAAGGGVRRRAPFPLRAVCAIQRPCAVHFSVARVCSRQRRSYLAARSGYQRARGRRELAERSAVVSHRSRSSVPRSTPARASLYTVYCCILSSSIGSGVLFAFLALSSLPGIHVCIPSAGPGTQKPLLQDTARRCSRPRIGVGRSHTPGWRRGAGTAESGRVVGPTFRLARALHRSPGVA